MLLDALRAVLLVFAALFPIVNPLGMAPIFLIMTGGYSDATRRNLARRVARNGFVLLVVSLFAGTAILRFFGITLPAVQVGGGLLVSAAGWRLLTQGADPSERRRAAEAADERTILASAFYPLTMPLTVGPGSIAVAVTLGGSLERLVTEQTALLVFAAAVVGLLLVAASIYVSFRFAGAIGAVIGETGTNVLVRLSAFILVCLGIQIVWNGLRGFAGPALAPSGG
jgi:multiple antibiotic resistance protein